jgi:mannosyltransferase OCH1-like enzyme
MKNGEKIAFIIGGIVIFIGLVIFLILKFKKNTEDFANIPKVIYKIFINDSGEINLNREKKIIQRAHQSWNVLNPEYEIKYFNKEDCRRFLKENFKDTDYLQTFDSLKPYAFKCDFFRYCLLYKKGGWYSDWKQECLIYNLLKILDNRKKENIVVFNDLDGNKNQEEDDYIQNNFMGVIPNSTFLKEVINEIINNVKYAVINEKCPLYSTGPALLKLMSDKSKIDLKTMGDFKSNYLLYRNKKIIKHKSDEDLSQDWGKGGNNYYQLWKTKNIYEPFRIKSHIPKIIYKTGPQSEQNLDPEINKLFSNTLIENPEFQIKYFDDVMCYNFIRDNFEEDVLNAYETIIPTAYKADLFRYCVLYINGGIYSDLTQQFLENIDDIINFEKDTLVLTEDFVHTPYKMPGIQISFMATIPKQELYRQCINQIVDNVKKGYIGETPLDVTGPYLCKKILDKTDTNYKIKLYQSDGYLVDEFKNRIVSTKLKNHNKILYSKKNKHYVNYWRKGKIYKKNID